MARRVFLAIVAVPILIVGLALSITALTRTRELFLPVSDLPLALSILLPILSSLILLLPHDRRRVVELPDGWNTFTRSFSGTNNFAWIRNILPTISQANKAIFLFTIVLLALSASDFARSELTGCLIEQRWIELFNHRDNAIRAIQDQVQCCGLNHPNDRAWPFPGRGVIDGACLARYPGEPGRDLPCRPRLEERLRSVQGSLTGSATAVFLVQLMVAIFVRMSGRGIPSHAYRNGPDGNRLIEEVTDGQNDHHDRYSDEVREQDAETNFGANEHHPRSGEASVNDAN